MVNILIYILMWCLVIVFIIILPIMYYLVCKTIINYYVKKRNYITIINLEKNKTDKIKEILIKNKYINKNNTWFKRNFDGYYYIVIDEDKAKIKTWWELPTVFPNVKYPVDYGPVSMGAYPLKLVIKKIKNVK